MNYKHNVLKNYLFTFFSNINFTSGLWMIYLSQKGFSLIELGVLESIFHISSMTFEIPSGALADLIGRKYCRLAGRFALLISLFIMYAADSFILQAAGFAVCAFAYNLESGSGEAFIYDTLRLLGEEQLYKKIAGYIEVAFQAGMIISFSIGGLLASGMGYFYVFLFSACAVIISFLTGMTFHEARPAEGKKNISKNEKHGSAFFRILADSLKLLKLKPRIMFLIIFSEIIFAFVTSLFFYLQNYLKLSGKPESLIGIIYAASAILSAFSSIAASGIEKTAGEKKLLILLPLMLVICLWGIGLTEFKTAFFILTGFVEGVLIVVISDYLNIMIPSEIRATVLSFRSMTFSIIMIILFPLIGLAAEKISFGAAFIIMAVIASVLTACYFIISAVSSKTRRQP